MLYQNDDLSNNLATALEDEYLFRKQKAVALEGLETIFKYSNYTRHERSELIKHINGWMVLVFNSHVTYEFPNVTNKFDDM